MASSSSLDRRRHLPSPPSPSPSPSPSHLHRSKAQAALVKIITIISTVPAPPTLVASDGVGDPEVGREKMLLEGGLGFCVDLSFRLGLWKEIGDGGSRHEDGGPTACSRVVDAPGPAGSFDASAVEEAEEEEEEGVDKAILAVESISPAESAAGDVVVTAEKSSEGECDPEEVGIEQVLKEVEEGAKEHIDGVKDDPSKEREGAVKETRRGGSGGEGYLDLLIEAVRQVSGGFLSDESKEKEEIKTALRERSAAKDAEEPGKRTSTSQCWTPMDYYEDTGPVVRSKRGRSQTLPSRYRDSVLEPWRKLPTANRPAKAAKP